MNQNNIEDPTQNNGSQNPDNSGKILANRDKKGRFIKGVSGNPLGKPLGVKNKFSPSQKIQEIWEEHPEKFQEFVDAYLRDPRNRQHIVEMIDGRPKGGAVIEGDIVQNKIEIKWAKCPKCGFEV